jgi:hypothetical protein
MFDQGEISAEKAAVPMQQECSAGGPATVRGPMFAQEGPCGQPADAVPGAVLKELRPETPSRPPNFKERANTLREVAKILGDYVKELKDDPAFQAEQSFEDQHGEMKANIILAFRHLEYARMCLGKAIQAFDGGVSCYDK